jgi:hypothetical protein
MLGHGTWAIVLISVSKKQDQPSNCPGQNFPEQRKKMEMESKERKQKM